MTETPENEKQVDKQTGRNEPCPCGSGKKYKRCCGVAAAPKLGPAPAVPAGMPGGGGFEQFRDQMDPQAMQQVSQALGRLPKAQLQKLQNIMQRAMAGKDVAREAQEFEHSLPVELQSLLQSIQMPGMPGTAGLGEAGAPNEPSTEMNEEEARSIVAAAAKEGKISSEEATELLEKPKGMSKFWKKFSGKS